MKGTLQHTYLEGKDDGIEKFCFHRRWRLRDRNVKKFSKGNNHKYPGWKNSVNNALREKNLQTSGSKNCQYIQVEDVHSGRPTDFLPGCTINCHCKVQSRVNHGRTLLVISKILLLSKNKATTTDIFSTFFGPIFLSDGQ